MPRRNAEKARVQASKQRDRRSRQQRQARQSRQAAERRAKARR